MKSLLLLLSTLVCFFASATNYYMSPTGADGNPGTLASPYRTLTKLYSVLVAGDTGFVRGGTYATAAQISLSGRSGTSATNKINIRRYQNEVPVFDYNGTSHSSGIGGLVMNSMSWVHLYGLRFTGIPQVNSAYHYGIVFSTNCNNCTLEFCEADHIGGSGINFGANCSNNLVLNCDAHHNQDPLSPSPYDGSNGMDITGQTTSDNNTFRFCRSWWNSDDGYDGFATTNNVNYEGCWAFWNGYIPGTFTAAGNGDGFKAGPAQTGTILAVRRTYSNCFAFENRFNGFDQNFNGNGSFQQNLYNNTAYKNLNRGFFYGGWTAVNTLKNNLAYQNLGTADVNSQSVHTNNSWDSSPSVSVSDADFLSVSSTGMDGARGANGQLPVLNFMRLASSSDLIDRGTNVGLPFNGTAPDIGAFEFTAPAVGTTYYIAPNGDDSRTQAQAQNIATPWKSLDKAWTVLVAGDIVYCRGGTYNMSGQHTYSNKNGTSANTIKIWNYPGEAPVFDWQNAVATSGTLLFQFTNVSWIHIKGLRATNIQQMTSGAFYCYGFIFNGNVNNCILENCSADHIGGTGIAVKQGNSTGNQIINCDSWFNDDPTDVQGAHENANGYELGTNTAGTLLVRGCRAWWNADDGFDGFGGSNTITFDNCWSFWNGFIPGTFTSAGDGMGFKIGPSGVSSPSTTVRTLTNCLAFDNNTFGFDYNNNANQYKCELYNNTAYHNGNVGFFFGGSTVASVFRNNLAYAQQSGGGQSGALGSGSVQSNNSWNGGVTVNDADFLSISSTGMNGARQASGALPVLNFMRLASTSDLIDKGVNVGLPFNGTAPDLGCFESNGTTPPPTLQAFSSFNPTIACNGGSTTVTVSATGGVPPYTGTGNFTRSAGTYTFTVTDLAGTTATTNITVTQPTAITISQSTPAITVNGGTTTTTITASGGTGTKNYKLDASAFQASNVFTGVAAGTHTITVRDANLCTNTLVYTLTQPTALVASSTSGSIPCNGATTTVTVTASGGTSPYTGTGAFTRAAGTYTFTVTDGGGAQATTTITVSQPAAIVITQSSPAITVNGGTTTTTVSVSGGVGTKNYKLDAGAFQASNVFSGVAAGTHTITVRDANLCTNTLTYTLTQPSAIVVTATAGTISCNAGTTTVTVSASGGTAPYTGTGSFTRGAGTFTFTVTDAAGSSKTATVTITQPAAILITQSSGTIAVNGGTTTTTVTASGGTGTLNYKLDVGSFQASNVFTGVLAGNHTITVRDANACTNTLSYTLTQPSALVVTSSATAIACNAGSSNVTVSASGGTPPYTGTGVFSRTAGTYSFNVTDGGGATGTTSVTITQPAAIVISVAFGAAPATVTVTASGGIGTLNYKLDAGAFQASNVFNGVAAGNHTVTVRDANLCTNTKTFTIGASLGITASATAITCNGGQSQVSIGATGGTPPYTGPGIYFQSAGTATYTVTDAGGAVHDTTITVTQPALISASVATGTILVNGGTTTVTVTASGGVGSLSYRLDAGSFQGSNAFAGVSAGNHTVTVRDANNCTVVKTFTITQPGALNISATPSAIACYGDSSSVVVTASGGTPPYSGTGTIKKAAGTHTISVADAFGAVKDTILTITQPSRITATVSTGIINVNGGTTTVTVTASGGTGALTYKLDAGAYHGSNVFSGVLAGSHTVTVKDASNCTTVNTFSISQPGALLISITQGTPIACNGGTMNVTVGASGGTSPYTGTGSFTRAAGTFTFTVTDAFGATEDTIVTITQPTAVVVTVTTGTITVNGGTTSVTVTALGGTGSKQYKLDAGSYQVSNVFTGVAAGNHTVTARDANNCTGANNFSITQPGVLNMSVTLSGPILCNGGSINATVTASGGTSPYTGTGVTSKSAGTYTFTVTDAFGARHDTIITITQPTAVLISDVAWGTISVYGGTTRIDVTAAGGTGTLTYKLDAGSFQSDSFFLTVAGGNHTVTVKDANACTGTYSFTVPQPPAPAQYYLKRRRARHVYIQL